MVFFYYLPSAEPVTIRSSFFNETWKKKHAYKPSFLLLTHPPPSPYSLPSTAVLVLNKFWNCIKKFTFFLSLVHFWRENSNILLFFKLLELENFFGHFWRKNSNILLIFTARLFGVIFGAKIQIFYWFSNHLNLRSFLVILARKFKYFTDFQITWNWVFLGYFLYNRKNTLISEQNVSNRNSYLLVNTFICKLGTKYL